MLPRPRAQHIRQEGAALFMALIFLLILTILGVFGMNMSRLENMMAGNTQFQSVALNNAEYALALGMEDVQAMVASGAPYPTGAPYYLASDFGIDPEKLVWDFTAEEVTLPNGRKASYIIENGGTENDFGEDFSYTGITKPGPSTAVQVFLVSAQSESARGAKRIVQSVVATDPLAP